MAFNIRISPTSFDFCDSFCTSISLLTLICNSLFFFPVFSSFTKSSSFLFSAISRLHFVSFVGYWSRFLCFPIFCRWFTLSATCVNTFSVVQSVYRFYKFTNVCHSCCYTLSFSLPQPLLVLSYESLCPYQMSCGVLYLFPFHLCESHMNLFIYSD